MATMPRVTILGPARTAVSGVSTHLEQLFGSALGKAVELRHFQVGREGREGESVAGRLWRLVSSPCALGRDLIVHGADIVHLNTSLDHKAFWRDVAYLLVCRALGRRVVYQVHGGALPQELYRESTFLTAILRRVLRLPDVIVLLAQVELEAYTRFVPQARCMVIPNAIDVAPLARARPPWPDEAPLRLVYIGRLARVKGIFETLAAVRLLRDRGIDVLLTFAGSGPDEAELREAVRDASLGSQVTLRGAVFGEEKAELWRSSDVFVFPTYHLEGLPYALLESMAAGAVPVVAPAGAIPDVVKDGVHGLFTPARDPAALAGILERLHRDRDALRRMSVETRRRIQERYTVERLAEDFRLLYSELCCGEPAVTLDGTDERA